MYIIDDFYLGGIILVITFLVSYIFTKKWIKIAKRSGLTGKDMNKKYQEIPESGGITVVLSFCLGLLLLIFLKTFIITTGTHLIEIMAVLITILLAIIIGFIDDILGWKKGLKQWQKPVMIIVIAIPLMVINAGNSVMNIPIFGEVNFGILYPLLIIPIGIVGASNAFNMIAGLNGLEAGMGIIILSTLGIVSFIGGTYWISFICFAMVSSLIGFLIYNKYPAKIFPGDSLTYSVGALIACVAILGNMQRIACLLFIPYALEFILKARGRFKKRTVLDYDKSYSIVHLLKKVKIKDEKNIVFTILLFEIVLSIILLTLFI